MIEKLRKINDNILDTSLDQEVLTRHTIIKNIMEDDACFFKIDIAYAYAILKDLGFSKDDLKYVYMKLIDVKELNE